MHTLKTLGRRWKICAALLSLLSWIFIMKLLVQQLLSAKIHASLNCGDSADASMRRCDTVWPVKLFIGIFSTADRQDRRAMLRKVYGRVLASGLVSSQDVVVIKHILATSDTAHIEEEQDIYRDLILLNTTENIDGGKTWHYFNHMGIHPHIGDHLDGHPHTSDQFDFVLKLDDDSYLNIPELVQDLRQYRNLSEVYYGRLCNIPGMPTEFPDFPYHCGLGYGLSIDLCTWIASKAVIDTRTAIGTQQYGPEDVETAGWLIDGGKVANFVAMPVARMYSFWDRLPREMLNDSVDSHDLTEAKRRFTLQDLDQRDIVVHGLKDVSFFSQVAEWFATNR